MSEKTLKVKNVTEFVKTVHDMDVQYVDFNFTDLRGKMHRITQHINTIDKDLMENGIYFDGSSIDGWKAINESDMQLKPNVTTATFDPFATQPTVKVFCEVLEPSTGKNYTSDPRSIALAAEEYMKSTGVADSVYFGPEAEFFVFEDVKINVAQNHVGYEIDSQEGPYNSGTHYERGNMGHRPGPKGGYVPEAPVDALGELRSEMLTVLNQMGVPAEKHHHEVAPSQCELGIQFASLTESADNLQIYKHVVHNVAAAFGYTATFLPKPVYGDNGSGMHCHQSLFKDGKPVFAGDEYAGLSETCLYYIGGIIKHARALNAFTNPSTNSYKRLVPGYEAPVLLAYSQRNRSASCRIPMATTPKAKRIEIRFPDPTANPYLAFSAMLMAGLDGIEHKIHPGDAMDKNLYDLPEEELASIPTVCRDLREALDALKGDHDFLLKGDVFTKEMIEGFIALKMEEVIRYETMPHPVEFDMYYSA
ncbi:MAG: type I glutamate--ammonia ligase [Alphaproteobacteria bacterium]|jgi:glutamine synthetase|nr:type I glutamate--ammonia ligase [Alphaproteobacteria bacterium]MDP7222772.1 type I glutamate--ammonia ligase [Alphaproteobacteria bacterium]